MRLIDADALWMGKFPPCGKPYQEGWNDALDAATTQAPTIDAVPVVHGRWIGCWHYHPQGGYHLWHCSKCDAPSVRKRNYCYECGVKMLNNENDWED
jgi:hypothetical protein